MVSGNDPGDRAQNTEDLLGKILRIDVDRAQSATVLYSSPSSNPFFGSTPGRDEIFASGLRNPWRFSFDRVSGQLAAADVGQGASEEIDIVALGGNYGWRVFEGTLCTNLGPAACGSNFVPPVDARLQEAMSIADGYRVFRTAPTSMAITALARSSY